MWEHLQHANGNSNANGRNRRRPSRGMIVALLLALILGGFGEAPRARAAPATAAQTGSLTASPSSITICKGQTGKVKVTASLRTARIRGRRASRQPAPYMSVLTAESGGSAATVSPSEVELTFRSTATMTFQVRGVSVGDAVINIQMNPPGQDDDLAPLLPQSAPRRSFARAQASVQVKVRECKYLLVLVSTWTIQRAWVYRVNSALAAEVVPDENGRFAISPVVENTHRQRIPYNNPFCTKTPAIEKTRANVDGTIDDRGRIEFEVTYDPVHEATTTIGCNIPYYGSFAVQAEGTGVAEIYDPRPVNIGDSLPGPGNGVGGTYPHTLHSSVGDAQGRGIYVIFAIAVEP